MVDPRNIQFEIIDDTDSPFQLEFNPKTSKFRIIDSTNTNVLWNDLQTFQHKGYIVEFELNWEKTVPFTEEQYNILLNLFFERAAFYIYPNPDAMPTLKFLVNWVNKFDFDSSTGWFDGWAWFGKMELVGAESLIRSDFPAEFTFNQY